MKSTARETNEERERRTIIVERIGGSFGFTLQSYGIHYREEKDVEIITYVDYVDPIGSAHKAGLRTGDVILSINGQDVERANHRTLVNIIQNCPSRMRMVVVFENCVRKVELHMHYIRLQQTLQQKAQEYQDICAKEKSLLARFNGSRRNSFHTTTHHYPTTECSSLLDYGCNPMTARSSKTMPRCYPISNMKSMEIHEKTHPESKESKTTGCVKKTSYFCISQGCDCDCCFHEIHQKSDKATTFRSPSKKQTYHRRSCQLTSCYTEENRLKTTETNDERYAKQKEWTTRAYGGYGFGYDYTVFNSDQCYKPDSHSVDYSSMCYKSRTVAAPSRQPVNAQYPEACMADPPYYRRSLPKSAEDLLTVHFQDQCQMSQTLALNKQIKDSSDTFYKKPPQPKSVDNLIEKDNYSSYKMNIQQHLSRYSQSSKSQKQRVMSSYYEDEGGFDEICSSRTLPLLKKNW